MGFKVKTKFTKTRKYLEQMSQANKYAIETATNLYEIALTSLFNKTPKDSGLTAASWKADVIKRGDTFMIDLINSNIVNGVNIARVLMYGFSHYYSGAYTPPNIELLGTVDKLKETFLKHMRDIPKYNISSKTKW